MTPDLEAAYAQPHRRYHTRTHIEQCLALLDQVPDLMDSERQVLTYAIWWHDAVYDPTASDNEAKSAEMAKRDLRDLDVSLHAREEVARLIRLTAGHLVEEEDRLGEILVSIDLAILAAAPLDYDAYAHQVREEYAHVPDAAWRAGRAKVMQHFLDAPVIYPDPAFRALFEDVARANIAREIASLA
ncbi:phosphohydrolase [Phenylobacterium sp.]|uniref:HD domain-containing protein n=1 Tax=Phenylobacterium sp. TaxID=1871053 RepID=UPI002717347A|nr:phosphohydrolase [Phenylobacterium sp.]MDO8799673.1 phosphohydrolase [Phenylobacterium sp.]